MQLHIGTLSFQLQIDTEPMLYHLFIVQIIASGCCDFIAQCIIVRINHFTYHPFYSPSKSSKIYRCWIVWGQNNRVVIIPLFLTIIYFGQSIYLHLISWFRFIASSYMASANWLTRPILRCYLGGHGDSNRFGRVHGREYPGDGLDRVQDPQGVLGS